MPVFHPSDAEIFDMHGSVFRSFVAPARGSTTLCAWQLQVAAGSAGAPHRPDREEVLLVQSGELHVVLDDDTHALRTGDVLLVPAGARLTVGGGPGGATAWVTTTSGLRATTDDGTVIAPPWAR